MVEGYLRVCVTYRFITMHHCADLYNAMPRLTGKKLKTSLQHVLQGERGILRIWRNSYNGLM